ncbi:MAG: threonylcarbamoyl-AMP synthase [Rickettsiales bacterium]|nr:threonylcarbamoyl-AMP synthase [Rickettsiales bacterium]
MMKLNTKIIKKNYKNILSIAEELRKGEIVAIPTETVYGLAGRYDRDETIKKIFKIKKRPFNNPLIIHYCNYLQALDDIYYDSRIELLAKNFWPGPLTIIAKKKNSSISRLVSSDLNTLAIRVPSNKTTLSILKKLFIPVAAPSANRYGKISPTSAQDVYDELRGKIKKIIDSGPCKIGLESTVVDLTSKKAKILRQGGIPEEKIKKIIEVKNIFVTTKVLSPGLSKSHYKPDKPIRINAIKPRKGEAWLAFGKIPKNYKGISMSLSKKKCLKESAKNLYKMLRKLDKTEIASIAVQKIPFKGLGLAINDRLKKAAYQYND